MNHPKIEIEHIAPADLAPNPWNSNRVGPEMEERLRASITEMGFYKPIVCRTTPEGLLQILGGEHRWRVAVSMGLKTVPVVNVGEITDKKAKLLGLADNGQYGEDDARLLSQILSDIGAEDVASFLPYSDHDLAGLMAATEINLDDLGFDDDEEGDARAPETSPRATITHEVVRFKIALEDADRVRKFIDHVIKSKGLNTESDSMIAGGMALVEIVNAAREVM
jgi:ParB family chromosome partitioning protein